METNLRDEILEVLTDPSRAKVWMYYIDDSFDSARVAICDPCYTKWVIGYREAITASEMEWEILRHGPLQCEHSKHKEDENEQYQDSSRQDEQPR